MNVWHANVFYNTVKNASLLVTIFI